MCGRTRFALAAQQVEQAAGVQQQQQQQQQSRWVDRDRYRPSYNISPGHWTPILRLDEHNMPMLQTMKWGLVPSFTKHGEKPDHYRMFNARSETVDSKPVFSRLLSSRRCVVLLEGFYEWKADAGGKKQPYYVSFGEGNVMKMAGLYDVWAGGEEGPLTTYTILTTDSSQRLSWLHDRMPVILSDDTAVAAWLGTGKIPPVQQQQQQQHDGDEQQQQEKNQQGDDVKHEATEKPSLAAEGGKASVFKVLSQVCHPYNGEDLQWHPVTPAMSKPRYDCPDCSKDIRTKKGSISSFFRPVSSPASKGQQGKGRQQQQQGKEHTPQMQQQKGGVANYFGKLADKKQEEPAARNPDEEAGPSAAEEAQAEQQIKSKQQQQQQQSAAVEVVTSPAKGVKRTSAAATVRTPSSQKRTRTKD